MEHIRGHLWHKYSIAVMVATVTFRSDDFNFTKRNPWFSSYLVSSNIVIPAITQVLFSVRVVSWIFNLLTPNSIFLFCIAILIKPKTKNITKWLSCLGTDTSMKDGVVTLNVWAQSFPFLIYEYSTFYIFLLCSI